MPTEPLPEPLSAFIDASLTCLRESPNRWLHENPAILERLAGEDWPAVLTEVREGIAEVLHGARPEHEVGTIGLDWDDGNHTGFDINLATTDEPEEWLEYEDNAGEVVLSVVARVFRDQPTWPEDLRNDLETVLRLFMALVEHAALQAVKGGAVSELPLRPGYLVVSATWHDVEKSVIFDSRGEVECYLWTDRLPKPEHPVLLDLSARSKGRVTLCGEDYALTTSWVRSGGYGWGEIPAEVGLFTEARQLELSRELLRDLPETLFDLVKAEHLDLSHNRLSRLPEAIGRMTGLKHLLLDNNALAALPEAIGRLGRLERLLLEYNRLTELPPTLVELGALEMLSLHDNELATLPELPASLTWLNLYANALTALPDHVAQLDKLETLVLSDNKLTRVPEQIFALGSLASLELGGNPITEVPDELLAMPALEKLRFYPNCFPVAQRAVLRERFGERIFVGYDSDPRSFMTAPA